MKTNPDNGQNSSLVKKATPDNEQSSSLVNTNGSSLGSRKDENSELIKKQEEALEPKNNQPSANQPTPEESDTYFPWLELGLTAAVIIAFALNPILGLLSILAIGVAVALANSNTDNQQQSNQVVSAPGQAIEAEENENNQDENSTGPHARAEAEDESSEKYSSDNKKSNSTESSKKNNSPRNNESSNSKGGAQYSGSKPSSERKERFVTKEEKEALELLGLKDNPNPSVQDVNKAYKKQALIYHPDRNHGNEDAAGKTFKDIFNAKEYLMPIAEKNDAARAQAAETATSSGDSLGDTNTNMKHPEAASTSISSKEPPMADSSNSEKPGYGV